MRTGWRLPPQFGTATLLLAQGQPDGPVVGLAHAIPPVQWLMEMQASLGRPLCLLLSRALVELGSVFKRISPRAGTMRERPPLRRRWRSCRIWSRCRGSP